MSDEKRFIGQYEIIQSVRIDGAEIVVAENMKAEKPYMMWRRSLSEPFGAEKHFIPVYDADYLKILRAFIKCQSQYVDNLDLDRIYCDSAPLDREDCVPDGMGADLNGKVVGIKAETLLPEYRTCPHQLMLATGGFGCSPDARGQTVYGVNLYSGRQECWKRSDILGVIIENALPVWAREKLAALQKPSEKESVVEKIRKGKQKAGTDKYTHKKQNKSGPEL